MRLAVLQHDAHPSDVTSNLHHLEQAAQMAAEHHGNVLLSPELFLTGADPHLVTRVLSPAGLRDVHQAVAGIASSYNIALAYSLPAYPPDGATGRPRVTSYFVDDAGDLLASYARAHLRSAAERESFDPGQLPPQVFDYQGTGFALSSGYDVQFPEHARAAALAGAGILLVPAAAEQGSESLAVKLLPTRAMENGIYLAWANHCSVQGGIPMAGTSTIIGADGQNLRVAGNDPQLIMADVDPIRQQAIRKLDPYLSRIRPELYGVAPGGSPG